MTRAAQGSTKPEAGVIATSPATAPAAAPIPLALPVSAQLANIQERAAEAAAVFVTTKALAAWPVAAPALPALKPNQPNQRMAAPRTIYVTVCGSIGSLP